MARRRTSVPERIAGDILGFTTGAEVEESESVLSKYFPELSLRLPAKGSRGGRLGRAPQTADQEISYKNLASLGGATGGAAPTNITVSTPVTQTNTTGPDYRSEISSIQQSLLSQSQLLKELREAQETKEPIEQPKVEEPKQVQPARSFTPSNLNPRTPEEAIEYLYQTELGRTPVQSEIQSWAKNPVFEDKSLTEQEWNELKSGFRSSPEYQTVREASGSTTTASPVTAPAPAPTPARSFTPSNPNPQTAEEAIKYLYQTQLGRTPAQSEVSTWLTNPAFADRSLTANEWKTVTSQFQSSPEYASIRR